jgi:hypothetical protein
MRASQPIRENALRWVPAATIAIGLAATSLLSGSKACAETAASKYDLARRVEEAAHTLADHPRLKDIPGEQRVQLVEFVAGNLLFVIGHEAGHAVIHEMGIPVIGREEDTADVFATLLALQSGEAFADRVLANAALGWFLSDRHDRRRGVGFVFYDQHGLDLQRAYNVVCLVVGSNKEKFAAVAAVTKLPPERQATCSDDYLNASWSWGQVLQRHLRKADQPKSAMNVIYSPGNGEYNAYAAMARQMKILESVADTLVERYVFPAPITLEMRACDEAHAYWELRAKKMVVCYEMAEEFVELYRRYGGSMEFALELSAVMPHRARERNAFRPGRPGAVARDGPGSSRSRR